jgi:hypothetical protein
MDAQGTMRLMFDTMDASVADYPSMEAAESAMAQG